MASLNKVMLIGNLTRDIELKYTPKGTAIAELGLAVNRRYKAENEEWKEEVTFIDVTLWGRQAEIAKEYLAKGRSVYIEGRLQLDSWDDKQTGQKRSKLKVTGEAMQMLGSRSGEGGGGGEGNGGYTGGNSSSRGSSSSVDEYDQRPAPRQQSSQGGSGGSGGNNQRPNKPKPAPAPVADDDDDIPF